jgi:hypothetical protein
MPIGLTDPLTALSFSAMPVEELVERHRDLRAAQRDLNHWRRLLNARIDLAVAAVADLEEPLAPAGAASYCCPGAPPVGLRELLGIATLDDRLGETAVLIRLRRALADLEAYVATVDAVTDEASHILAHRLGAVA